MEKQEDEMRMKYGLKLWSNNDFYLQETQRLYNKKVFDYVELYTAPESHSFANLWQSLAIPYIIHVAHSMHGFNLSLMQSANRNKELFDLAYSYFVELKAMYLILHPGVLGIIENTISQLNSLLESCQIQDRKKILVENKPLITLTDDSCLGATPEEVFQIKKACEVGFVLDITHAVKYAIASNKDWQQVLKDFMELSPTVIHVSDAYLSNPKDEHKHIGHGELDFLKIFSLCNAEYLTVETEKDSKDNLNDFENDINLLQRFINI